MKPMFFDYPKDEMTLKRVKYAMATFETYLSMYKTKYVAGDHVTVGDFTMFSSTLWLEGVNFDFSEFTHVKKWYEMFKKEQSMFWELAQENLKWIIKFSKNTPEMSGMMVNHPFFHMKH